MHVNEHTLRSLRRAFVDAGFDVDVELGLFVYTEHVPSPWGRRAVRLLAKARPLAQLGIADIWAVARAR